MFLFCLETYIIFGTHLYAMEINSVNKLLFKIQSEKAISLCLLPVYIAPWSEPKDVTTVYTLSVALPAEY